MAEPYNIKDKKPKKKGAHGLIDAMIEKTTSTIKDVGGYALQPFIGRDESQKYLGGKEGLDIADPFDIGYSTLASGYRLFDRLVRRPLVLGGMKIGDKIAAMSGESIQSQEEAEIFLNRYDPKGSNKEAGYDITYNPPVEDGKKAKNYFRPKDTSGWLAMLGFDGKEGINIQPHEGVEGVEPITAAEEVEHGRRWSTDNSSLIVGKGDLVDYGSRLHEETMAKGTALKNVFKNEGAIEGIASMPSLLSTYLSYLLPSSGNYDIGEVGRNVLGDTQESGKDLYKALREQGYGNNDRLDLAAVKHPDYKTFMKTDPDTGEEYEGSNYTEVLQKLIPQFKDKTQNEIYTALFGVDAYQERQEEKNPFSVLTNWWQRGQLGARGKEQRKYHRRSKRYAKLRKVKDAIKGATKKKK